ncbi:zinc ribbon domain-containing protein [Actinomadura oligospora]|uniref:zinc ribbon domain-containing protein n=1 Tax=Actinomadura oligospora TaxID=111804 RepID=UPI00047C9421|nr:zinc ribbon domain-containing protein [Actinomadura oligospora]
MAETLIIGHGTIVADFFDVGCSRRLPWANSVGEAPSGRRPAHRPTSQKIAHAPLVSEEDFVAAQAIRTARPAKDGTVREYLLAGLMRCRVRGRRMDAHWVNDHPGYRCRHGHNSAKPRPSHRPRNLYIREDRMLTALGEHLPGRPPEIADHLRDELLTIVCDTATWTLAHADNAQGPIQTDLLDQFEPGPHPFMG